MLHIKAIFLLCFLTATVKCQNAWIDYLNQEQTDIPKEFLNYLNVLNNESNETLPEVASKENETVLVDLVKKAGLADALSSKGPFTLFGPTNSAFNKIPKWVLKYLSKNITALGNLLKYHVASGAVLSNQLKNNQLVPSLNGQNIRINIYKNGKVITASGASVVKADVEASNGVLHEIDSVMMPPFGNIVQTAKAVRKLFILVQLVRYGGLTSALSADGTFTLFAPTNSAFLKLGYKTLVKLLLKKDQLIDILKYHVIPDAYFSAGLSSGDVDTLNGKSVKIAVNSKGVMVNNAKVLFADLNTNNGVIHIIDKVLLPPKTNLIGRSRNFKIVTGNENSNILNALRLR